jgi:hypothetical protein
MSLQSIEEPAAIPVAPLPGHPLWRLGFRPFYLLGAVTRRGRLAAHRLRLAHARAGVRRGGGDHRRRAPVDGKEE